MNSNPESTSTYMYIWRCFWHLSCPTLWYRIYANITSSSLNVNFHFHSANHIMWKHVVSLHFSMMLFSHINDEVLLVPPTLQSYLYCFKNHHDYDSCPTKLCIELKLYGIESLCLLIIYPLITVKLEYSMEF